MTLGSLIYAEAVSEVTALDSFVYWLALTTVEYPHVMFGLYFASIAVAYFVGRGAGYKRNRDQ